MTLGQALAGRVHALGRANERLSALDDQTADHVVEEADAQAVLRRALAVLSTHEGYEIGRRVAAGERVTPSDELARAGLVVWDPGSDTMRASALLIELMTVLEAAVGEATSTR